MNTMAAELRLDLLINPFAPSPLVRGTEDATERPEHLAERLCLAIAGRLGVSPGQIVPGQTVDALLTSLAGDAAVEAMTQRSDFAGQTKSEATAGNVGFVSSPDLETGSMLTMSAAVRLARAHRLLIIDERAGGFAHRDHLPLFREFEHVALLRSFDNWIAPISGRLSYLVVRAPLPDRPALPDNDSLRWSLATLADQAYVDAAMRTVARERVRLARSLRKLNMVRPLPSASGFVAARVERGDRDALRLYLDERGIRLRYPESEERRQLVRISAVSSGATERLCAALIDWAATLDS